MRLLISALTALMLLATPVVAGDLEDGLAAYQAGDYQKAFRLWKSLAEQGDAGVQFNLGVMYARGEGVPEDDAKAVHWYRKAAEQGSAKAHISLGLMYYKGEGVPEDFVRAYAWTSIAAAQGDEITKKNKDIIKGQMTPAQIAEAQKLSHELWEKYVVPFQ
jgi:hypothetical protein